MTMNAIQEYWNQRKYLEDNSRSIQVWICNCWLIRQIEKKESILIDCIGEHRDMVEQSYKDKEIRRICSI